MLLRAFRFAFTGVFMTALHATIAVAIIRLLLDSPPLANGAAFIVATLVSYYINTRWSFSARLHGRSFARFLMVALLGFFLRC